MDTLWINTALSRVTEHWFEHTALLLMQVNHCEVPKVALSRFRWHLIFFVYVMLSWTLWINATLSLVWRHVFQRFTVLADLHEYCEVSKWSCKSNISRFVGSHFHTYLFSKHSIWFCTLRWFTALSRVTGHIFRRTALLAMQCNHSGVMWSHFQTIYRDSFWINFHAKYSPTKLFENDGLAAEFRVFVMWCTGWRRLRTLVTNWWHLKREIHGVN